MKQQRRSGHATGMAGEFFTMERLFRLGHEPALTLGNAKTIDILVRTATDKHLSISVKSACGGGKWSVDKEDLSAEKHSLLVFVFLRYKDFENVSTGPEVWVMPATEVQKRKKDWFAKSAIYYSHAANQPTDLGQFKDAWHHIS